jgi:hypothetical protein
MMFKENPGNSDQVMILSTMESWIHMSTNPEVDTIAKRTFFMVKFVYPIRWVVFVFIAFLE